MTAAPPKPVTDGAGVDLPPSWSALPEDLRKPFWSVAETARATGISRSALYRLWADPRSTFPRRHRVTNRVPAIAVLRHLEEC